MDHAEPAVEVDVFWTQLYDEGDPDREGDERLRDSLALLVPLEVDQQTRGLVRCAAKLRFSRLDIAYHVLPRIDPRNDVRTLARGYRPRSVEPDATYDEHGLGFEIAGEKAGDNAVVRHSGRRLSCFICTAGLLPPGVCGWGRNFIDDQLDSALDDIATTSGQFLNGALLNPPKLALSGSEIVEELDPGQLRAIALLLGFGGNTAVAGDLLNSITVNFGLVLADINADPVSGAPALEGEPLGAPDGSWTNSTLLAMRRGARFRQIQLTQGTFEPIARLCLADDREERCRGPEPEAGCEVCDFCERCTTDCPDACVALDETLRCVDCGASCPAECNPDRAVGSIPVPDDGLLCTPPAGPPPGSPECERLRAAVRLPASPTISAIMDFAPTFATAIREVFTRPLEELGPTELDSCRPGRGEGMRARYTDQELVTLDDGGSAMAFSFLMDGDGDEVHDPVDNCPLDANPEQTPADGGEDWGAACDRCPGIATEAFGNGDLDCDGDGNGCDCDIDGDGCFNRGPSPTPGAVCYIPAFSAPDEHPLRPGPTDADGNPVDLDGDGHPDECDPDDDGDGVRDGVDNCPRVPNADQKDSGGIPAGDACDPLCPGPGAPGCPISDDDGPGGGGRLITLPRLVAEGGGAGGCATPGSSFSDCVLPSILPQCEWNDRCVDFGEDYLQLYGSDGVASQVVSAAELGSPAGIGPALATVPDMDGDGFRDIAVGAPEANRCLASNVGCSGETGQVILVGATTGEVIDRVEFHEGGARGGSSVASIGPFLAIGAPGARDAQGRVTGAVHLYRTDARTRVATIPGSEAGERFGRAVVAALDASTSGGLPVFLAGAPNATTGAGPEAGRIVAISADGAAGLVLEGPVAGGHLGVSATTIVPFEQGLLGFAAGAPGAFGGDGAVAFFGADGRLANLVRGGAGERLGTALAQATDFDLDGFQEVAAGAPGALGGQGEVRIYSRFATLVDQVSLPLGAGFGTYVKAPGDVDGDGAPDLAVGVPFAEGFAPGDTYAARFVVFPGIGAPLPPFEVPF